MPRESYVVNSFFDNISQCKSERDENNSLDSKKRTVSPFTLSLFFEMVQLVFRIGNFQFSDLAYYTLGGFIGGLIYRIGYKVKNKKK